MKATPEIKRFSLSFGNNAFNMELYKLGQTFKARSWGLNSRKIELHKEKIRDAITEWVEAFGEEVGDRLYLETLQMDGKLRHKLKPVTPDQARSIDLNGHKDRTTAIFDTSTMTEDQLSELKENCAKMGLKIRDATEGDLHEINKLLPPQ